MNTTVVQYSYGAQLITSRIPDLKVIMKNPQIKRKPDK